MAIKTLFFVFLAVVPVLLTTNTLEHFEYPKSMWLRACALCFLAPVLIKALNHIRGANKTAVAAGFSLRCIRNLKVAATGLDLMTVGVLLFAASAIISTLTSLSPRISFWGEHTSYAGLATILAYVMVYFTARTFGHSLIVMERLLIACLLAGAVASIFAILQMMGVDPVGWQFPSDAGGFRRPFGTLGHPNHLGAYLAMVFPLAWYFTVPQRRRIVIALGLVLLAGMVVALSRAAWLGWAAGMAILAAALIRHSWHKINRRRVLWFLVASVALIFLLGWWNPRGVTTGFRDRLANLNSGQTRFQIWQISLDIVRAYPVFGAGPDAFQLAFAPRRTPAFWHQEWNTTPTHAHNEFLQVLATQGIVGAIAVLIFLLGLALAARRALSQVDPRSRRLSLGLLTCVVVFLVVSQFSFTAIGCGPVFLVAAGFLSRLGERPRVRLAAFEVVAADSANDVLWYRPAVFISVAVIFLQFAWSLSFGFSAMPSSFWLAILIIGMTLTGAAFLLLRGWADAHSSPRAGSMSGAIPLLPLLRFVSGVTVAVAMIFLVILPWLAHIACARGDKILANNPILAIREFEEAVARDPAWDIYWTKLVQAKQEAAAKTVDRSQRQPFLRQAQAVWDYLTKRSPLNGFHHDNRGQCLALLCQDGLARPQEVFASFDEALQLDPSNPLFHADAADARLRLGRPDKAWDYAWAGVKGQFECGPLYGQIGYLLLERGRVTEAVRYLEEAMAGYWDEHENWKGAAEANLIAAYHRIGNFPKVETLACRFLQTHAEAAAIRFMLAEAQKRR